MRGIRRGMGVGPRRMLWRGIRQAIQPAMRQELMRANSLLDAGQTAEAGEIFARLLAAAEQHGVMARAAQLAARAAHAFLQTEDAQKGIPAARRAIRLAAQMGDWEHAARLGQRVIKELERRGFSEEANALRAEIEQALSQHGLSLASASAPDEPRHLPSQCPACFGPVRSDEVEWIDEVSAECSYCGSTLQTS